MANSEQPAQPAAQITPEAAQAALSQPVRVEATPGSTPAPTAKPDPNRPAGLPEKFKSWEDMAKSYTELEKKLSAGTKAEAPKTTEAPKAEASKPEDLAIKAAEKAATDAGLDLKPFHEEFAKSGGLSEDSYKALEKAGIAKELVDQYIEGQKVLQEKSAETVLKSAGLDMDGYSKLAQWAMATLPPNEVEAYNRIVTGTDADAARLALQGLHSRYTKSIEPNYLRANEAPRAGGDVFRSTAELTKAMSDPRYKSDPAYRQDVADKLGRSNIL